MKMHPSKTFVEAVKIELLNRGIDMRDVPHTRSEFEDICSVTKYVKQAATFVSDYYKIEKEVD